MYNRRQEIYEAIYAGEQALESLSEAEQQLDSASKWGLLDIFGGNMVSGLVKHSRINDANRSIAQAKQDLRRFERELGDIRDIEGLYVDIDGFLTFADFFFDGFIADVLVQSKIDDTRRQVRNAIYQINRILDRLEREV